MEIAALYAGITDRSIYYWQERGRVVHERLQEEEEKEIASLLAIAEVRRLNKTRPKNEQEPLPERYKPDMTVYKEEETYLQFFRELQEAKGTGAITHLNHLNNLAPTDPKVSMWILAKRFPDAFGERPSQVQHSGPDGGPIQTKDVSDMPMEERIARLQAILMSAANRAGTAEGEADAESDGGGVP